MTEILVRFEKYDGSAKHTLDVSPDLKLGDAREAAQMLLGLPDNPPCRLVLERTKKELSDHLTFNGAGIQEGDKLILIPSIVVQEPKSSSSSSANFSQVQEEISGSTSPESLVRYTLTLSIISNGNKPKNYDYSIELEEFYEDNPKRFFSDFNGRERQNFETSLQQIVPRELEKSEIDQILEEWCDDISFGYHDTTGEI